MKIFETLLGHVLGSDITETDWWTDAVFRALEQDRVKEPGPDASVIAGAADQSAEMM
jgi:hypothetical protein